MIKTLFQWKLAILLALWFTCFFPVYPALISTWLSHSDNSHGLLVPLISLYLIYRKKEKLAKTPVASSVWGVTILVLSLVAYLVAYAGGLAFLARCMIVTSLFGLAAFCLGPQFVRITAFPLAFLLFMVPIPDSILNAVSFPLQLSATRVSTEAIAALSIPVYREGNMVYFANSQLEIAEACSGIRSIMSLIMLSVLLCYVCSMRLVHRVILVASAVPIAFAANILRIVAVGLLSHFFGSKLARGFLHDFSGLAVFALGLILLSAEYLVLSRLKKI